jgi:hypothetical protein
MINRKTKWVATVLENEKQKRTKKKNEGTERGRVEKEQ